VYAPEVEFEKRFGAEELEQALATNGGLTYDSAAADADALIDSYLAAIPGRTFLVPLTVPPARVIGLAADLTRYELWANRASEEIRNRRDQAIEFLKDLVAGRAVLLLEDPEIVVPEANVGVAMRTNCRVFTDTSLAPFVGSRCDDPLGGLRGCD
jgi:phage gp36-like protein